jgi:hypothetical protein
MVMHAKCGKQCANQYTASAVEKAGEMLADAKRRGDETVVPICCNDSPSLYVPETVSQQAVNFFPILCSRDR